MDNSAKIPKLNKAALIMNICQTFFHLEGNHFSFCRFDNRTNNKRDIEQYVRLR